MSTRPSIDAAVPSSFGPSSSRRAPQVTASRKGPNDVRVKPANPDVISDLLDSFDVISGDTFPSPIGPARNASRPRTPKASRPNSRGSHTISIKPSTLTHTFTEVSHPIQDPTELPPDEDAAEPPVIRTARYPSGFSKVTSRSSSEQRTLRRKLSSPRMLLSPPPERETTQRPSTETVNPRTVRASRESSIGSPKLRSVRESTDSLEDAYNLTASSPPSAYKGKSREVYTPRSGAMRSAAYDSQRAGTGMRSPPTSSMGFFSSSARPSDEFDRSSRSRPMNNRRIIAEDEPQAFPGSPYAFRDRPSTPPNANGYMPKAADQIYTPQNGRIVPERKSSLMGSEESSPVRQRRSSLRSTKSSPDTKRKQAPPIPDEQLPTRIIVNEDSDNDETLRRIKELKARREERENRSLSMKNDSGRSKVEAGRTMTMPTPIMTNGILPKTSRQLRETKEVEEHRISDERERNGDPYDLVAPPMLAISAKPTALASSQSGVMKGRYGDSATAPVSRTGTAKNSVETPKHSRHNSWSKRWSPMAFSPHPKIDMSRPSIDTRPQTPRMQAMFGIDERRASVDSIHNDVQEYLSAPRMTQKVQVTGERRKVCFSEFGDPNGHAIMCCVGMGLTRYIMAFYDELATSLGLRLITLDRPGIGDSDPYVDGPKTPLSWPDDVLAICEQLHITRFSLLAHSAGAVYALATALRLPHYLRGKIHLLAPWIPPSQLIPPTSTLNSTKSTAPAGNLPKSQRFLRMLPSSFLKLSNSSFGFSSRSSSPKPNKPATPKRSKAPSRRTSNALEKPILDFPSSTGSTTNVTILGAPNIEQTQPPTPRLDSFRSVPLEQHSLATAVSSQHASTNNGTLTPSQSQPRPSAEADTAARQRAYTTALTPQIWALATRNANPSVDLLICLERHRTIGFSYSEVGAKPAVSTLGERPGKTISAGPTGAEVDGNQWPGMGVVIWHGTKDQRVPVENVRWLRGRMMGCSVREFEGLGHGLMAEAGVMGRVLKEIAEEWEVARGWEGGRKRGGRR